jgi:hypothetical protein
VTDLFVAAPNAATLGVEPTPTATKVADVAKGAKLTALDDDGAGLESRRATDAWSVRAGSPQRA